MIIAIGAFGVAAAAAFAEPVGSAGNSPRGQGSVERGGAPLNGEDDCADATLIAGYGTWAFDFQFATTDGPTHQSCISANSSQIWRDRWWRWTSPATGSVTVDMCGQTSINTRMAVYAPATQCPTSNEYLISCVDDVCSLQPSVTFLALEGQTYLFRIGRTGLLESPASGAGTFTVSGPAGPDPCPPTPGPTQLVDLSTDAFQSNQFSRTADDFSLVTGAPIVGVCWWGSYFQFVPDLDGFTVTYWTNAGGRPGMPIASFSQQSGLQLRRLGTNDSDYQDKRIFHYTASHAPVALTPGTTYWLEIRNFVEGVAWRWQGSDKNGNGSLQDFTPGSGWSSAIGQEDVAWRIRVDVACEVDTNGDGVLDFADLNNIVTAFNTACP